MVETGDAILYSALTFFMILFDFLAFYLIASMNSRNRQDEEGNLIGINPIKYVRLFIIGISYGLIIVTFNLMNVAASQLTTTQFKNIVGFLFETMLRGAWIWTVLIIILVFYNLIRDSNIRKNLKKFGRIAV